MNFEEVENQKIHPLISRFRMIWSEDDKFGIITEKGLLVYDYSPHLTNLNQTLHFFKFLIKPELYIPLQEVNVTEKDKIMWNCTNDNAHELIMNSDLSLIFPQFQQKAIFYISEYVFSPRVHCGNCCLLACLTNCGALHIYIRKTRSKYNIISNISELWVTHCLKSFSKVKVDFNILKTRVELIKINTMHWMRSVVYKESVLLTGHENGQLVIWKVKDINDNLDVNIMLDFDLKTDKVCLITSKYINKETVMIVVSYLDGTIDVLMLKITDVIKLVSIEKIWQQRDKMKCTQVNFVEFDNRTYLIVSKQFILLAICYELKNTKDSMGCEVVNTFWHYFPSVIISCHEHVDSLIVTLENSHFDIVSIGLNTFNVTEDFNLDKHEMLSFGVTTSNHKLLWIATLTPKKPRLRKSDRSWGKLVFLTLTNGLTKLKIDTDNSLSDVLDVRRLTILKQQSVFSDFTNIKFKDLTVGEAKILYWEARLLSSLKNGLNIPTKQLSDHLAIVVLTSYFKRVILLTNKSRNKTNSGRLMNQVLNAEHTELESIVLETYEPCKICNAGITKSNIRFVECVNKHVMPRCCLSLLPCTEYPYASCKNCNVVALLEFVPDNNFMCVFCDAKLILEVW